jgi:AcrR family transcriptional regulator
MDKVVRKRRGGPRTFDRTEAVDTAMRLFWRHGYEGVSLNDLTSAIGVAPPSLYAAFGSKAGLYRETLDHYAGLPASIQDMSGATSLRQAVDSLLSKAIDAVIDPERERGCMVSSGMLEFASEHAGLALNLAERRNGMRALIEKTLVRWLDAERAGSLARYLVAVLQGLSVQARDGASRQELEQVATEVIAGIQARNLG